MVNGSECPIFQIFPLLSFKELAPTTTPPKKAAQSWPHGVHLFGLRDFADEVHVGVVVDLWIHGISMGSFKSELTMDNLDKFEAGNYAVSVSLWIP